MLAPAFERRAREGAVRECHGDLHLENLLLQEGRFVPFDAIEFNPNLRWIDVANDIAFLAMDLMARERQDLAFAALSAWLEANGAYDSLAVMRFYLAYRSMVRAVVTAIRRGQDSAQEGAADESAAKGASARLDAGRYVELAAQLVDTPPPRLYLMHGLSGSGKTWFSERLVGALPALRVRSDLERKRLAGQAEAQEAKGAIASGLYAAEVTERTYETLARCCETGLRAGFDMIADATFLRRGRRARFHELAASLGASFAIVECQAPPELLEQRLRERAAQRSDASDADVAVLRHQLTHHDPLSAEERAMTLRVDSGQDAAEAAVRLRTIADRCAEG
ncbi:MAG TPA: AAA family ATPase [Lysobacter sp.]|nr:AAA family ATPase [Lysobacter sp.]